MFSVLGNTIQTPERPERPVTEVVSLDAGSCADGILALDLWDWVIEVLERVQGDLTREQTPRKHINNQTKIHIKRDDLDLVNVDYVSTNAKSCRSGAMFNIFEDNEAVINMIIKGRSPTMRHVSRTHRVALDCFSLGSTLTQKSKSSMLTPKTKSQTY